MKAIVTLLAALTAAAPALAADPTVVNGQITDAVTQAATKAATQAAAQAATEAIDQTLGTAAPGGKAKERNVKERGAQGAQYGNSAEHRQDAGHRQSDKKPGKTKEKKAKNER